MAISNHRLLAFDGERVTFSYKDYARGDQRRTMTLNAMEFLRRFVQHILPRGFVRIRQSGFLANACRTTRVALARTCLATPVASAPTDATTPALPQTPTRATWACPRCGAAMLIGPILSALQIATLTWSFDTSGTATPVRAGAFVDVVAHDSGGVCADPLIEPSASRPDRTRVARRAAAVVAPAPPAA